jgi:anti-anti-sigma factor
MQHGEAKCQIVPTDDASPDGRLHLALVGELDISSTSGVRIRLDVLVGDHRHVVIDIGGLTYMGASGLAMLVSLRDRLQDRDGSLQLCRPTPRHLRLLEMTHLQDLLAPVG